jgi:hypothetical protein
MCWSHVIAEHELLCNWPALQKIAAALGRSGAANAARALRA